MQEASFAYHGTPPAMTPDLINSLLGVTFVAVWLMIGDFMMTGG